MCTKWYNVSVIEIGIYGNYLIGGEVADFIKKADKLIFMVK